MNTKDYLNKVAYIAKSEIADDDGMIYYSEFDKSYITRVGMEDSIKHLADLEITDELTHGVGFSPKDNKWYGWSHRAIYGFEIGSTCKKGDCHFNPSCKDEFIEGIRSWWHDEKYNVKTWVKEGTHREELCEYIESEKSEDGLVGLIKKPGSETFGEIMIAVWIHSLYNDKLPNESLRGTETKQFQELPEKYGRGEWTAKTMEDAKQMAVDFNEGVS